MNHLVPVLLGVGWLAAAAPRASIGLDGAWQFRTDPLEVGRTERWYRGSAPFPASLNVPGCWQAQGIGEPAGILRHHYAGAAWYRRTVAVPGEWKGRSFWSFPRNGLLKHPERPVFSAVKWAGLRRFYPFVAERNGDWDPRGVVVASDLGPQLMDYMEAGGRVLLLAAGHGGLSYFPPPGGAIGTLIRDHPALRGFPHGAFAGLQFYTLEEGSGAVPLDRLPKGTEPIIGAVRTAAGWLSQQKDLVRAAQLFEGRHGRGRLLAVTLRVRESFDEAHPEVIYFFDRLLRYVLSDEFEPEITLSAEQVATLARE